MSYLHRPVPAAGGGLGGAGIAAGPSAIAGGSGAGGRDGTAAAASMSMSNAHNHAGNAHAHAPAGAGPSRLFELLDHVKSEFELVSGQAESMRRDNHDYAIHADKHLAEVSAIRRELTELEREHTKAKQAYEDKIADLRRQLDTLRAQSGQGPPIPSIIPATTNHFGGLMGHPLGLFGQQERDRDSQMERDRPPPGGGDAAAAAVAGARGDARLSNGSNGASGPHQQGPPSAGHGREQGRPPYAQGQQQSQHAQHPAEAADRAAHEREMHYHHQQQQLGKRSRLDESREMHEGQPPSSKTFRLNEPGRPLENGVESRTSAAAAHFPPVRPPSRTYAQSPHGAHGRPVSSAAVGARPGSASGPGEPSVLAQAPSHGLHGPQSAGVDVKPTIPALQRPSSQAPPSGSAAQQQHDERTRAPGDPPQPQSARDRPPDWDVTYNHEVPKKLEVSLLHTFVHKSVVCCVRVSPDGKLVATGCNRNTNLYDTKTGALVAQLAEEVEGKPDNYIRAVVFSPDGTCIATGSEDKIIRVWDLASRKMIRDLQGHASEIYSLAFSPDGSQIISGSGDRTARVWSLATGATIREMRIQETRRTENGTVLDAGVTSVSVSPDGRLLVAGSLDHVVRIWDLHTGALLERLRGHRDSVYSVAYLPGGKQLLTGSLDKTLKIWDLAPLQAALSRGARVDPENPTSLTVCRQTLGGHKDYVLSVAASPDGNWVASGSKDRAVQFWDVRTGKPQLVLHGHKNSVISIAMSETGSLLATGSGDWQARLFKITGLEDPIAQRSERRSSGPTPSTNQAPRTQQPQSQSQLQAQQQPPSTQREASMPAAKASPADSTGKGAGPKDESVTDATGHAPSQEDKAAPAAPGTEATNAAAATATTAATASASANASAGGPASVSSPSAMKVDSPTAPAPATIVEDTSSKEASASASGPPKDSKSPSDAAKAAEATEKPTEAENKDKTANGSPSMPASSAD